MINDPCRRTVCDFPEFDVVKLLTYLRMTGQTPKNLLARLEAEERVEVRDAVNEKRLLGTLPRKQLKGCAGRSIRVPATSMTSLYAYAAGDRICVDTAFHYADFERSYSVDMGELTASVHLTTATPLDRLLQVQDFRLPGEDENDARCRRGF